MESLPDPVLEAIILMLDAFSFKAIGETNKRLHKVANKVKPEAFRRLLTFKRTTSWQGVSEGMYTPNGLPHGPLVCTMNNVVSVAHYDEGRLITKEMITKRTQEVEYNVKLFDKCTMM